MPMAEIVLIVMAFLMIGALMAAIFDKVPIPYTVILVLIGAFLQWPSEHIEALEPLRHFELTPDIILFIFLPALIFEAGLGIYARQLAKDIAPILMLAIPALLISTFIVGTGVSLIAGLPFLVALVFGALISATDPVAVIALFKELGAPRRLTILVEGESLFNDATAIVLFNLILGLLLYGGFSAGDTPGIILDFAIVFLGGALLGVLTGTALSLLVNSLNISGSGMLVISLTLAYLSFIVGEHNLHVSGVMAVTFSALAFGLIVEPRLPERELHSLHNTWEFLSNICNTLLFILIGYSINLNNLGNIIFVLLLTMTLVTMARASVIYSLVPLAVRFFKLPTITRDEQHIMWWGGLKGGLAIAMVLSLPESIEQRQLLIDLTAGVVMFTMLVNAPSIRIFIQKLGIDSLTQFESEELKACIHHVKGSIEDRLQELTSAKIISPSQETEVGERLQASIAKLEPASSQDSGRHYSELKCIGWEINELENLFRSNTITRLTYLAILDEKLNHFDFILRNAEDVQVFSKQQILRKFDSLVVKTFREKDWAVPLMSRYLTARLEVQMKNIIAYILVCRAVLNRVGRHSELDQQQRDHLMEKYQSLLNTNHNMLRDMKNEFPLIYMELEEKFALRAALASASKQTESGYSSGNLSVKPYRIVSKRINELMGGLNVFHQSIINATHKERLTNISLFKNVPEEVLRDILDKAAAVGFIAGDTIIGEGDSGNALYVILNGDVDITDTDETPPKILATLGVGDFFGEMALLGEFTRTANVEAKTSCVLLRITHRTIKSAMARYPGLYVALEAERRKRAEDNRQ
jgi:monovalent cation:H+ antiporter, CPA1 family